MKSLTAIVREYLEIRRGLGFKLREAGVLLPEFAAFMARRGAARITTNLALQWATRVEGVKPPRWGQRLAALRPFAKYMSARDPRTEIPPPGALPAKYGRVTPYVFTIHDIRRLVDAAGGLKPKGRLRRSTYSTLIALLGLTGLRTGEAVRLSWDCVDLGLGILTVKDTKFGKTRLVPLHPTVTAMLKRYADKREKVFASPRSHTFFLSERGGAVSKSALSAAFHRLRRQLGIESPSGRRPPRLHDLRHAFAVRTLLDWYRRGTNVEQRMPVLSTYLGHASLRHTYWYLSAVPELLRFAAARLERNLGGLQ